MTGGSSPFQRVEDGVAVAVHLTPKASRASIEGIADAPGGGYVLRVKVTAAPEKGKANAALLKLLAKEWGVAPSRLGLVSGHKDRRKRVLLEGDPA
ncbi:MAG: DUF167 domain-containing protein, partial [Proteobacteria bacterium]|nr:DUF167 domain-containing protein [Pseudomonadota bacterium]